MEDTKQKVRLALKAYMEKRSVTKWVGFCVACIAIMCSSTLNAYNAYANDLKSLYNVTQYEIEMIASLGNVGQCLGLPAGLYLEKYGPAMTFAAAMLFTVPSYVLVWNSGFFPSFYHDHVELIVIYMFLCGVGNSFMNLAAFTVSMNNFPQKHRGKVAGISNGLFWIGPAVFAAIYSTSFQHKNDTPGYFLTLAILDLIINILAMLFVKDLGTQDAETKVTAVTEDCCLVQDMPQKEEESVMEVDTTDITGWRLLSNPTFQLLSWCFLLNAVIGVTFFCNLSAFLLSYDLLELGLDTNEIGPSSGTIAIVVVGVISDRYIQSTTREFYVVIATFLQTTILVACIFSADNEFIFMMGCVSIYMCSGVIYTVCPTLFIAYFGIKHFPINWGCLMLAFGILSWIVMTLFGIGYSAQALDAQQAQCYGLDCFLTSFIVGSAFSFTAAVLALVAMQRQVIRRAAGTQLNPTPG